jgi:hypothetical protein
VAQVRASLHAQLDARIVREGMARQVLRPGLASALAVADVER